MPDPLVLAFGPMVSRFISVAATGRAPELANLESLGGSSLAATQASLGNSEDPRGAGVGPGVPPYPGEPGHRGAASTPQPPKNASPPQIREIAAFGTRGDGKTWGAFGAMIAHAQLHHAAGYPLPVRWAGVTDTFRSHQEKTHESLMAPGWRGVWGLVDGGHEARCVVDGQTLVRLRLFGIEDQGAMNRLRMETTGLWFEEPAPALAMSSGIGVDAWTLGMTSQRVASHCKPALITTNYPDEEHWTWQRFVVNAHPGTCYFRIPPGERATPEDRAQWAEALRGRPDLTRRLLTGEPGTVQLGEQVAHGFNYDTHVYLNTFGEMPVLETLPLWFGHDGGHTPTTVIGQRVKGELRILAALSSVHAGMRQHATEVIRPWLARRAPWALVPSAASNLLHRYDPSMATGEQADIDQDAVRVLRETIGGRFQPGPVDWYGRLGPLNHALNLMHEGRPSLRIDARECKGLITALNGAWYYATDTTGRVTRDITPKKPNHPHEDYGDAFCYLLGGMAPSRPLRERLAATGSYLAKTAFHIIDHNRGKSGGRRSYLAER